MAQSVTAELSHMYDSVVVEKEALEGVLTRDNQALEGLAEVRLP